MSTEVGSIMQSSNTDGLIYNKLWAKANQNFSFEFMKRLTWHLFDSSTSMLYTKLNKSRIYCMTIR